MVDSLPNLSDFSFKLFKVNLVWKNENKEFSMSSMNKACITKYFFVFVKPKRKLASVSSSYNIVNVLS